MDVDRRHLAQFRAPVADEPDPLDRDRVPV
jgi:hypothetical protein